ncbi:sensor domain-containing diguanylate cyclase [Sporosarcina beigongshangi]|uniref:sensor domain-containing diguanylate cyclase n=1 Tax=Sporosarcina beigongshangi TaxID=2782538 RepID=UPI0019393849|nr:sensor domain-containing diguanylate cyclase [Sporosarcina beigongshangi]
MNDYQLILFQIKNELIDLITKDSNIESYGQWFEILRPKLGYYFDIEESDFFISNHTKLMPIGRHRSATEISNAVPIYKMDRTTSSTKTAYIKEFTDRGYEYGDDFLPFRDEQSEILGLLLVKSSKEWQEFSESPYIDELEHIISRLILAVKRLIMLRKREKDARRLYGVMELFNATMNSEVILDGIVEAISESFPDFPVELFLSHEQKKFRHSYKLLDYMNERALTMTAFVSGEVTVEEMNELEARFINVPIVGRQGTYGVLRMEVPIDLVLSASDDNFIRVVATTAGNSLENASLYDQSHRVIEDLQLINETSRKLNSNMPFNEMIAFLKQQLKKAFRPMETAFVFYDETGGYNVSPVSSDFFRIETGSEYIELASASLKSGKEALFEANYSSTVSEQVLYESIIAIPIMNQEKVAGFVMLVHKEPYYFSFESFKLMGSLIGHSSLALANSILQGQLQELVDKDNLTKLYTRTYLDKIVEESIGNDEEGVFLLLDVDNFKLVNDTYGHAKGDEVLKQISSAILSEVGDMGTTARWGGEEIAVYLPLVDFTKGVELASRLVELIPSVTEPQVTVSMGLNSRTKEQRLTFQELFHYTDTALYMAKNNGKNQFVIYGTAITQL